MECGHEKALGKIIQVLPKGKYIVPLTTGTAVETTPLHPRTETTDGDTVLPK